MSPIGSSLTPSFHPELIARLFRCPEDGGELRPAGGGFACARCAHAVPLRAPNIVDLMPDAPSAWPDRLGRVETRAAAFYARGWADAWQHRDDPRPWNRLDLQPPRIRTQYRRMARLLERMLPARLGTFLDISAGNGGLSLPLAARCDHAVYADLMLDATLWVARHPGALAARVDYLKPPYRPAAFDTILCTDTLIYGARHEAHLLKVIWDALAPGGTAVLSFHNRRHHLPVRPAVLAGYTRPEVLALLTALEPAPRPVIRAFYQEAEHNLEEGVAARLVRAVLPATRWFVTAVKPA